MNNHAKWKEWLLPKLDHHDTVAEKGHKALLTANTTDKNQSYQLELPSPSQSRQTLYTETHRRRTPIHFPTFPIDEDTS